MPIRPYLGVEIFDEEVARAMGIAFERACATLGLSDKDDLATRLLAEKVIEVARSGERDAKRLSQMALEIVRRPMPNASHFNDPEHWHNRAEEARVLAERMSDEASNRAMLKVADDYDQLAVRAALRLGDEASTNSPMRPREVLPLSAHDLTMDQFEQFGQLAAACRDDLRTMPARSKSDTALMVDRSREMIVESRALLIEVDQILARRFKGRLTRAAALRQRHLP